MLYTGGKGINRHYTVDALGLFEHQKGDVLCLIPNEKNNSPRC